MARWASWVRLGLSLVTHSPGPQGPLPKLGCVGSEGMKWDVGCGGGGVRDRQPPAQLGLWTGPPLGATGGLGTSPPPPRLPARFKVSQLSLEDCGPGGRQAPSARDLKSPQLVPTNPPGWKLREARCSAGPLPVLGHGARGAGQGQEPVCARRARDCLVQAFPGQTQAFCFVPDLFGGRGRSGPGWRRRQWPPGTGSGLEPERAPWAVTDGGRGVGRTRAGPSSPGWNIVLSLHGGRGH